jgi:hypothetical protein
LTSSPGSLHDNDYQRVPLYDDVPKFAESSNYGTEKRNSRSAPDLLDIDYSLTGNKKQDKNIQLSHGELSYCIHNFYYLYLFFDPKI